MGWQLVGFQGEAARDLDPEILKEPWIELRPPDTSA